MNAVETPEPTSVGNFVCIAKYWNELKGEFFIVFASDVGEASTFFLYADPEDAAYYEQGKQYDILVSKLSH